MGEGIRYSYQRPPVRRKVAFNEMQQVLKKLCSSRLYGELQVLRNSFSIDKTSRRLVNAIPDGANKPRQKFLVTMDLTPASQGVSALITVREHRNSPENL